MKEKANLHLMFTPLNTDPKITTAKKEILA